MPDSAQMSAVMSSSMRRMRPAQFVLDHRAQLALTPEQLPFFESLVLAEADSIRVRAQRRNSRMMAAQVGKPVSALMGVMAWSGPLDEAAIRKSMRDGAEASADAAAEAQIELARDRRVVGAALTPAQLALLPGIEAADMMTSLRGMGGGTLSAAATSMLPKKGGVYFEFQVEKQVAQLPGFGALRYPEQLRGAKVEGEVLAQFVVDSLGRYEDGSFKVLKSSHELFTQSVSDALPLMRFTPAEFGGLKVRQLVQQPFVFSLKGVK